VSEQVVGVASDTSGTATLQVQSATVESVTNVTSDALSVYQVSVLQVNVPYNIEVVTNIASDVFALSSVTVSVQQPTTKVGGGVSLPWYVWALIALFVIDVLSSRRRRR